MKQHPIASEQLSAFIDGTLEPSEERRIELHLPSCDECRRELASFRTVKAALAESARHPLPKDLLVRIERRLSPLSLKNRLKGLFARPVVWAPVSVLALAAGLFFVIPISKPIAPTVPLEVLMASHARYQSEALAPRADVYQAHFSAHVADEIDPD